MSNSLERFCLLSNNDFTGTMQVDMLWPASVLPWHSCKPPHIKPHHLSAVVYDAD